MRIPKVNRPLRMWYNNCQKSEKNWLSILLKQEKPFIKEVRRKFLQKKLETN